MYNKYGTKCTARGGFTICHHPYITSVYTVLYRKIYRLNICLKQIYLKQIRKSPLKNLPNMMAISSKTVLKTFSNDKKNPPKMTLKILQNDPQKSSKTSPNSCHKVSKKVVKQGSPQNLGP